MFLPQQLEAVAEEKIRSQEKEMRRRRLLQEISHRPPPWQRWTGDAMVRLGAWLMRRGEWMARRHRDESVPVAG